MMLLAQNPVISVNGNAAALAATGAVPASRSAVNAGVEINLFHRTEERVSRIAALLRSKGCDRLYGEHPDRLIPGLSHPRAKATSAGIYSADVVFVPLEDGDRCEALVRMGKKVIVVDLNPLSRSAKDSDRDHRGQSRAGVPNMVALAEEMKGMSRRWTSREIVEEFHNDKCPGRCARRDS